MPDLLQQLKQKYQPVLDAIQKEGAQLQNVNIDANQLYIKATANSEASKNRIWDAIKAVDANHSDLKHDIEFRQVDQTYTVQPGGHAVKDQQAVLRRRKQVSEDCEGKQSGRPRQDQGGTTTGHSSGLNNNGRVRACVGVHFVSVPRRAPLWT